MSPEQLATLALLGMSPDALAQAKANYEAAARLQSEADALLKPLLDNMAKASVEQLDGVRFLLPDNFTHAVVWSHIKARKAQEVSQ